MGATLPSDSSKDHLLHTNGYKQKEVAIGDWAEDLLLPLARKEAYRELPIPGEDRFARSHPTMRELYTFTEDNWLGNAEEYQPPPAGWTVLEWGDLWQKTEVRVNLFWTECRVFYQLDSA